MVNFEIRELFVTTGSKSLKLLKPQRKYAKWKEKMSSQLVQRKNSLKSSTTDTQTSEMRQIHQPVLGDCRQTLIFHIHKLFDILTLLERSTGVVEKSRMI